MSIIYLIITTTTPPAIFVTHTPVLAAEEVIVCLDSAVVCLGLLAWFLSLSIL